MRGLQWLENRVDLAGHLAGPPADAAPRPLRPHPAGQHQRSPRADGRRGHRSGAPVMLISADREPAPAPSHAGTVSRETGPCRAIVQAWPAQVTAIPAMTTSYQAVVHPLSPVRPGGVIDR